MYFPSSTSQTFGIAPGGNLAPDDPNIVGQRTRQGYAAPMMTSTLNGPSSPRMPSSPRYGPGNAPGAPMLRFANGAGGPAPGPAMYSSAPSSPAMPSVSIPRIAGDAPNMTPGQAGYNMSHSPNWLMSLDRQRRQTATAEGTFANDRNQGLDATTAGRDSFAASHGINATGAQPTNQPVIGDFKELEGVHQARIKAAQWEYEQASKNFDAAGKEAAMDRYHQATSDLDQLHQQHLGLAPGAAGGGAPFGGTNVPLAPSGGQYNHVTPPPNPFMNHGETYEQTNLSGSFPSSPSAGGTPSFSSSSVPGGPRAPGALGSYTSSPTPSPFPMTSSPGPQTSLPAPNQTLPPGSPGYAPTPQGSKGQIGITEATARQMWKQVVGQSGVEPAYLATLGRNGGPAMETSPAFQSLRSQFAQTMGKYGVSPTTADSLLGRWQEAGNLHQFDVTDTTPPKTNPAPRIPLSMIGPETGRPGTMFQPDKNGLPIGSYGNASALGYGQSESVPGPTVSPAATVTPTQRTTRPMPGNKMIRRPDAAPQQQQAAAGAGPGGTPLALSNGRTAYLQTDGSYTDERGRVIR